MNSFFQQFKVPILFIARFLAVFVCGSLAYGAYIQSLGNEPDVFSWFIGNNLKSIFQEDITLRQIEGYPAIELLYKGNSLISLFEGCNGMAVIILFFSFIIAYRGRWMDAAWFSVAGIVIIHLANLLRLSLLLFISAYNNDWFHFMHKYFFSLVIYLVVFALWAVWIVYIAPKKIKNEIQDK